ncbi:hypothetical protein ACFV4Q_36535 [Streptomyces nojiriensis]|uniref:hypothetical protein n=1 Tax=Streptomyces nojiriensis TaxID=66374 RepID=UPI00365FC97B
MKLTDELTLRRPGTRVTRHGSTCSGSTENGTATEWHLVLPGRPLLTLHDTHWGNGERDLVLHQPSVVPEMPALLANLHGRRRAGVEAVPAGAGRLRLMAWTVVPRTGSDRAGFKKSLTTAELAEHCGLSLLRTLTDRPGVTLEPAFGREDLPLVDLEHPQDVKPLQHALYFPVGDDETSAMAYVVTRVMPTLRAVGWLPSPPEV